MGGGVLASSCGPGLCICVADHISRLLEHVLGAHMGGVNQINLPGTLDYISLDINYRSATECSNRILSRIKLL